MRHFITLASALSITFSSCYQSQVQPPDESAYFPPIDSTASEADDAKAINDLFLPVNHPVTTERSATYSSNPSVEIEQVKQQQSTVKTFSLTQTELYPSEEHRAAQDFQTYTEPISGVIKTADFYHGYLEVAADDGEYYMLRIEPDDLPTSLKTSVHYYMKPGNRIKCVCTLAGARELIIVSVTFTETK